MVFVREILPPKVIPDKDFSDCQSLLDIYNMLTDNEKEWTRLSVEEGIRKGIRRGRQSGRQEGIIQTAINMVEKGIDFEDISKLTGLPMEKVKNIPKNRDKYTSELEE